MHQLPSAYNTTTNELIDYKSIDSCTNTESKCESNKLDELDDTITFSSASNLNMRPYPQPSNPKHKTSIEGQQQQYRLTRLALELNNKKYPCIKALDRIKKWVVTIPMNEQFNPDALETV